MVRPVRLAVKAAAIDVIAVVVVILAPAIVVPKRGTTHALGGPWLCLT